MKILKEYYKTKRPYEAKDCTNIRKWFLNLFFGVKIKIFIKNYYYILSFRKKEEAPLGITA